MRCYIKICTALIICISCEKENSEETDDFVVQVTEFGAIGERIKGTFSGTASIIVNGLINLIQQNANLKLNEQKRALEKALDNHRRYKLQRDDVTVVGIKL